MTSLSSLTSTRKAQGKAAALQGVPKHGVGTPRSYYGGTQDLIDKLSGLRWGTQQKEKLRELVAMLPIVEVMMPPVQLPESDADHRRYIEERLQCLLETYELVSEKLRKTL